MENTAYEYEKQNYKVRADFLTDGTILPVKIKIVSDNGDERVFNVHILKIRPGASLKIGVSGIQYTVIIGGQRAFLYLTDDRKWYLEPIE